MQEHSAETPLPQSPSNSTGASKTLTRRFILEKALELADEIGTDNITVRRLAQALGKTPMALYRHFDSIAEVQQGVLALAFEEVDTHPIPGERWDDTIRRTTASMRRMYLRHDRARLCFVHSSPWGPGLHKHTENVQKLHGDQNIPEDIFDRAWRIIDAFFSGFIINESFTKQTPTDASGDQPDTWRDITDNAYSDQAFSDGIEIIIAGIRNLAAPDPCEWRTPE